MVLAVSSLVVGLAPLVLIVVVVGWTLLWPKRGHRLGTDVIVRCRDGHLFTTIWIPGVSFKAIKLGWVRFQRCPVANHWTLVTPVADADLSEEDRLIAGNTATPNPLSGDAGQRLALEVFRVTAARRSVFNAFSLILSPSRKSMARLVFPSRLELNRPEGSFRAAPLAKVIFTTLL